MPTSCDLQGLPGTGGHGPIRPEKYSMASMRLPILVAFHISGMDLLPVRAVVCFGRLSHMRQPHC